MIAPAQAGVETRSMVGTRVTPEELLGSLDEVEKRHAPAELFFEGDKSLVTKGARVSIVGSRKTSEAGTKRAQKLAALLSQRGVVVVSGLAEGIDAAAHTTAIECGGRTIAVLGTPLDVCFPAKHRALQERIMREHLAISQFAPGKMLGTRAFPMRNRTMALLSDATVIVEAGEKSGTVHQGWEALRLGRPLYIMESLAQEGHEWTSELQRYGALVLSDKTKDLFLESIPGESRVERIEASF
jgi:DNA processing protein